MNITSLCIQHNVFAISDAIIQRGGYGITKMIMREYNREIGWRLVEIVINKLSKKYDDFKNNHPWHLVTIEYPTAGHIKIYVPIVECIEANGITFPCYNCIWGMIIDMPCRDHRYESDEKLYTMAELNLFQFENIVHVYFGNATDKIGNFNYHGKFRWDYDLITLFTSDPKLKDNIYILSDEENDFINIMKLFQSWI